MLILLWADGGREQRLYNRNLFHGAVPGRGRFLSGEFELSHSHLYVAFPDTSRDSFPTGYEDPEGVDMTQDQHRARYMESQKHRRAEGA